MALLIAVVCVAMRRQTMKRLPISKTTVTISISSTLAILIGTGLTQMLEQAPDISLDLCSDIT